MQESAIYFFYGDEAFLIEEAVSDLKRKLPSHSKERLSDKFSTNDLFNIASTTSLFSEPKLILMKNPWFLFDAVSEKDAEKISEIIRSLKANEEHVLVIYVMGKNVDQRKKLAKFLKKEASLNEFSSFKAWEQDKVLSWIDRRFKKYGKSVDRNALLALEQIGGVNLRHIALEIEKIVTYLGERKQVLLDDVLSLSSSGASASIFHFNEAMKAKNLSKVMEIASLLLKNGEDPIRLLALIASNVRFYFQILCLSEQALSIQDIARSLGKNPYYLKQVLPHVKNKYSVSSLKNAFSLLNKKDIEIKSGKINAKAALSLALMGICS
jgi:DNA polymerase III subunit delta